MSCGAGGAAGTQLLHGGTGELWHWENLWSWECAGLAEEME